MDAFDALVENHALFTEQFAVVPQANSVPDVPDIRLRGAVLEDGIYSITNFNDAKHLREKKIFNDAKKWLLSDDIIHPFAFRTLCDIFNLDYAQIRKHILEVISTPNKKKRHHRIHNY